MPGTLERIRRFASPVTLLLGALFFLLPFCAMSCNAGPLGPSGDVVSASGLNLATGGDTSLNCAYLQQIGAAVQGIVPRGTITIATPAPTPGTGPCGVGATRAPASASASQKAGPFDGSTSSGDSIHVDVQPVAIVAAALLVLGALAALARGRAGALGGLVLATASAASLVILRVTLTSSFDSDLKASSTQTGGTSAAAAFSGIDPTQAFQLTWGIGWWLAVVAAAIGALASFAALAGGGLPTTAPSGGPVPQPWGPPGAPGTWRPPPPPPPSGGGGGGGPGAPPSGGWSPPA